MANTAIATRAMDVFILGISGAAAYYPHPERPVARELKQLE
jgi:hypothetical protein